MKKVGLIDQNSPQIIWLGSYTPNTTQKYPNEFMYKNKIYQINDDGYWKLNHFTTCCFDPWITNGQLCGITTDLTSDPTGDKFTEQQAIKMANFVLDDEDGEDDTYEQPNNGVCKFFTYGKCTKGSDCQFIHTFKRPRSNTLCKFYPLGQCKKGLLCTYRH